ncbi:MAG: hypothetical protein ACO1QS_19710 [Verrucomicrobiota bacterium]
MSDTTASTPESDAKPVPKKRSWRWRFFRFVVLSFFGLVTLFVLFHAVENWRGKRAWEQYRKEQEAKGVSFDFNSIIPPPIPDEKNFAMTPLLKPLYELNPPGVQPRHKDTNALERIPDFFPQPYETTLDLPTLGSWRYGVGSTLKQWQKAILASTNLQHRAEMGEPADDVLYALKQFDAQLEELHLASKSRPLTRYPVNYEQEDKVGLLIPHLVKVKNITKVLSLRAAANLEKDAADAAFEDINLIFFLADPLKDEPFLISHLVRYACVEYAMTRIWLGMVNHRWKEEHLVYWQKKFAEYDYVKDSHRALQGERLTGNATVELIRKHPHGIGNLLPGYLDNSTIRVDFKVLGLEDLLWRLIPSGWFYFERVNYNHSFDRFLLSPAPKEKSQVDVQRLLEAEKEFAQLLQNSNPINEVSRHMVMVRHFMPALGLSFQKSVRAQSTVDLAVVAMALERYHLKHQDYPEDLATLVPDYAPSLPQDILSKAPFKYERQSKDAFRLWSVGWNLKDDGGVIVRRGKKSDAAINLEEGDWTWPQVEKAAAAKPTAPAGAFE